MQALDLLRPYGIVAPIMARQPARSIAYGAHPGACDVNLLKDGIKTYTEQIEDEHLLQSLAHRVAEAEVIVFLGFGFHQQNMKLLMPGTPIKARHIIASAYETSEANKRSIRERLLDLGTKQRKQVRTDPVVTVDPNICGQVLKDNRRDILAHDLH